jgi:hypothetical protein
MNNAALFVQVLEAVAWMVVCGALLTAVVYLACAFVWWLIRGERNG